MTPLKRGNCWSFHGTDLFGKMGRYDSSFTDRVISKYGAIPAGASTRRIMKSISYSCEMLSAIIRV
jgi:hypothetical protein